MISRRALVAAGLASVPLVTRAVGTSNLVASYGGASLVPAIVTVASSGAAAGAIAVSYDLGLSFVEQTAPENNSWESVTFSPSLQRLVAVSDTGSNRVMYSDDGVTWNSASAAAALEWKRVRWSEEVGLFVAVAATGTGNRVMTSPDGITWTSRSSAADLVWGTLEWFSDVGLYIAAVSSGATTDCIMTSPDGINWTRRTTISGTLSCMASLGGLIAARSQGSFIGLVSGDGVNWTTTGAENSGCRSLAAGNGLFVVLGPNNSNQQSSPDGVVWSSITMTDSQWLAQRFLSNGEFLAISTSPDRASSRSSDGVTWVDTVNALPSNRTWNDMVECLLPAP